MTMRHLQYDELRTAVAKFIAADPDGDVGLTVFAESLGHFVSFMFNHKLVGKGRDAKVVHEPVLLFSRPHDLPPEEYARRVEQAGLKPTAFPPHGEIVPVTSAERGASDGLAVIRTVYGIAESEWLFITDEQESDYWPRPLPRPLVWPPTAS